MFALIVDTLMSRAAGAPNHRTLPAERAFTSRYAYTSFRLVRSQSCKCDFLFDPHSAVGEREPESHRGASSDLRAPEESTSAASSDADDVDLSQRLWHPVDTADYR